MQRWRIASALAAGLVIGAVSLPAALVDPPSAAAQKLPQAKKKSAPKGAPQAAPERRRFTAEEEATAAVPGIPDARAWGDSEAEFSRLLSGASGPWLAISGGGSDGAFGAGVLSGWSESGKRPEFAVVTGVSIGALIAPYAFLGSRYDADVRKNFTTVTAADIFEDRMLRDALFDDWPLRRQIEQQVTPKLLSEIAAEHSRGRRLLVATTNLDAERRVVWNMGAIAVRGGEAALKLFREVLLASSSIPGFFAPVPIEVESNGAKLQEMHGDGTITAPFFVVPESMLSAGSTVPAPTSELYIMVNSKLGPEFSMVDPTLAGVLGRSIAVALTAALKSQLVLTYAGAQRKGITVRVAHVDEAFNFPSRGPFDGKYMQALFEQGVAAGRQGTAFVDSLPQFSLRGEKTNTP